MHTTFETILQNLTQGSILILIPTVLGIIYRAFQNKRSPPLITTNSGSLLSRIIPSLTGVKAALTRGYELYPTGVFKIRVHPFGTVHVVNGVKLVEELRSASDDYFSPDEFGERIIQNSFTLGKSVARNRYHLPLITTSLTRSLTGLFPEIIEEMEISFQDAFKFEEAGWKEFTAYSSIVKIVCQTSSRVLVGSPLCKNVEYQNIVLDFSSGLIGTAMKIGHFPDFLHPLVGPLFSKVNVHGKAIQKILGPVIQDRRKMLSTHGPDWIEKPNDFLMWVLENNQGQMDSDWNVALRMLEINFAAIHTTSMTFTHALLHLATNLEWQAILREEVKTVLEEDGWTKGSMQRMKKVDSFLRESARLNSIILNSLGRKVRKDYTFSDGTLVAKGQWVMASAWSTHMDKNNYDNPTEFQPWRFANQRMEEGESTKHQMVATSADYLAFGLGRHACPGRFFAANELKAMLCYVVLKFDVKFDDSGGRPPNTYWGLNCIPAPNASVLFRKRA